MDNFDKCETLFDIILLLCSCAFSLIIYFYYSSIESKSIIFHVFYAYCLVLVWLGIKWATIKAKDLGFGILGRNLRDMQVRYIGLSIVSILFITFVILFTINQSTYELALIPIVYILALIRSAAVMKGRKSFFYLFYYCFMLILYGSLVFLNSNDYLIILSLLSILLITLLLFLNLIIIINTISKIIASIISCIIIVLMLSAYINGNSEAQFLSLLVSTLIPLFLSLSCTWVNFDMNYYKKTSLLLILWVLIFNIAMKTASRFYEEKMTTCADFLVYMTIFIGVYFIAVDFLFRISKIIDREIKNAIFLSFFVVPAAVSVPFSEVGSISVYAVLGIVLGFILLGVLILAYLKLYRNIVDCPSEALFCRDWFAMLLSALWKVAFITSFSLTSIKLHLNDNSQQYFWSYVTSNILILSCLLTTCFLENVNFFEKEKNHDYPSLKRIIILKEIISTRHKGQLKNYKKSQKILFVLILIKIILSLIFLLASPVFFIYSIIILILEMMFGIIGIELKYRVWNHGELAIEFYNFFLWISFYMPYLSFIVPEIIMRDYTENAIWYCAIIIIVCFFTLSSVLLSYKYNYFMDLNMWQMICAAREKKYDKNKSKIIAEAAINYFYILDIESILLSDRPMLCSKCANQDHKIKLDENSSHDSAVLNFLLLNNNKNLNKIVPLNIHSPPILYDQDLNKKTFKDNTRLFDTSRVQVINDDQYLENNVKFVQRSETERSYTNNNYHNIFIDSISKDMLKEIFCDKTSELISEDFFLRIVKEKFGCLDESSFETDHLNYFHMFPIQFDDLFIQKTINFLAKSLHSNNSEASCKNVLNTLLKEKQDIVSTIKKAIVEKLLIMVLKIENLVEFFIPYNIFNSEFSSNDINLYEMLRKLKEKRGEKYPEIIDKCILVLNGILLGNFFDTYAIASLALTDQLNWLNSKASFCVIPLFINYNWIISLVVHFSFCIVFILCSLTCLLLIKKRLFNNTIVKFVNGIVVVLSSGAFIEMVIGLLSFMNCEYIDNKGFYVLQNDKLKCFSPAHIIIFITALVLFIVYFLFVLFFYPFIFKAYSNFDNHFNFDISAQVFYCMIFVFIPQNYLNLKMIMSLLICAFLCIFWVNNTIKRDKRKINYKTVEYFIGTLIYLLSLAFYNFEANYVGFWILVVIICGNFFVNILLFIKSLFQNAMSRDRKLEISTNQWISK
ncbi:hypothetical protein SteCoe_10905 [Stentor coeruleus]|uniref:Transmembrane protein n=1 Tax=Stentor coeruleus TaxID=5963 RepID=A0A1R2CEE1_9CILI|nr:hypothetical protein SteCoe_10905 [Stentor coeruleus]